MSETASKFIKRLVGFSIGPVASAFIGFITIPITTRLVDPAEFGKSTMFTLSIGVISILMYLGVHQSYLREYHVTENKDGLFRTAIILPFFFSLICAILCLIFYKPISLLLYNEIDFTMILYLSLLLPTTVIMQFCELRFRMQEHAKRYSFFLMLRKGMVLIGQLLALLFYKRNYQGIVTGFFIAEICYCVIIASYNRTVWIGSFTFDPVQIKKMLRYGLPLVPATILNWIIEGMDKVALRTMSDLYHVGLYSAAFKIASILNIIQLSFSLFWAPTALRWFESKIPNKKFYDVSLYMMSGMTIVFCSIAIFRKFIITLLDIKYYESYVLIPFLLFVPIMYTISEVTGGGINFYRKTEYNIIISALTAGLTFVVNFTLIPIIGYIGAGISAMVAYIAFFWGRTLLSRKLWFKMPLKWYLINTVLLIGFSLICYFFDNFLIEVIVFGFICVIQFVHLKRALLTIVQGMKKL